MIFNQHLIWEPVGQASIYILEIKEFLAVKFGTIEYKQINSKFKINKKKQFEDFIDIFQKEQQNHNKTKKKNGKIHI